MRRLFLFCFLFLASLSYCDEVFIDVGDAKIFCTTMGNGDPLIVLHGGPGGSQDYLLPGMEKLGENHFVIFYDQRGCGQSIGKITPETINLEKFVADLEAVRKAFGLEKISILGHSWGGFLAMQYAIKYPDAIDKLILSNSVPASSKGFALFMDEYKRRTAPFQEEINQIRSTKECQEGEPNINEYLYRLITRTYLFDPNKIDLLNMRRTRTAVLNGTKVHEMMRNNVFMKPFDFHKALQSLSMPTLVIHGDFDPIPPITAQEIHQNIEGSQFILMQDCGHFPYVEKPEEYFSSLNEFLNE